MKQSQHLQQHQKIENDGNSVVKRSSTQLERCIAIGARLLFCTIMFVVVGTTFDAFIAYFHGYADSIIHTADIDMTNKGEMDFTFALDTESWFQSHLHTLHVDGMECGFSMKIPKYDHRNLKSDSNNNSNEILEYYEEAHVAHLSLLQSFDLHPRSIWTDIIRIVNSADVKTKDEPEDADGAGGTTSHFLRGSASTSTASSSASSSSTTSSSSSPMSSTSPRQQVADNHKVTTKMGITQFQFSSFATLLSTLTQSTQHNPTSGGVSNSIGVARCVLTGRVDMYSMGQWGVPLQDYPLYQQRSVNLTHIMSYNPNPNYRYDLQNGVASTTSGSINLAPTGSSITTNGGSGSGSDSRIGDVVLSKSGQSNASSSYPWLAHTLVHALLPSTDHLLISYLSNSNALSTNPFLSNAISNSHTLPIKYLSNNNALPTNVVSTNPLPTNPFPSNALSNSHTLSINALPTDHLPINHLSSTTAQPTSTPTGQPTNRLTSTHPLSYPYTEPSSPIQPLFYSPLHMNPPITNISPITMRPCNRDTQLHGHLGIPRHV